MARHVVGILTVALLLGTSAAGAQQAQGQPQAPSQPAASPKSPTTPEPSVPRAPTGQPVNVKLDLTITDQAGAGEPSKKVITLIVADRQNGHIRSRGSVWLTERRGFNVTINVDARPEIIRDNTVKVDLGLEYQPTPPTAGITSASAMVPVTGDATNLNQRIGVILESGKPLVISQAVDPASDRRVSVDLKATILR